MVTRRFRFGLSLLLVSVAAFAIPLALPTMAIRRHVHAYERLQTLALTKDIAVSGRFTDILRPRVVRKSPTPERYPKWLVDLVGYEGASKVALYGTGITDTEATTLSRMLHVNSIELFGTRVTRQGIASLPRSTKFLMLIGPTTDDHLLEGLAPLHDLRRLSVSNISVASVDINCLSDLASLEHVVLWNTDASDSQVATLRALFPQATIERFNAD